MGFVTFWVLSHSEFCHIDSFCVLSYFEFCEFCQILSFVTFWLFGWFFLMIFLFFFSWWKKIVVEKKIVKKVVFWKKYVGHYCSYFHYCHYCHNWYFTKQKLPPPLCFLVWKFLYFFMNKLRNFNTLTCFQDPWKRVSLWYQCFYQNRSRQSLSNVCRILYMTFRNWILR